MLSARYCTNIFAKRSYYGWVNYFTKRSHHGWVNMVTSSKRKQEGLSSQSFLANSVPACRSYTTALLNGILHLTYRLVWMKFPEYLLWNRGMMAGIWFKKIRTFCRGNLDTGCHGIRPWYLSWWPIEFSLIWLGETKGQRWARDRTGSDWIRTEANFGRMRTGSDWVNFCCFNVIILKISKILVVIPFHRFAKW